MVESSDAGEYIDDLLDDKKNKKKIIKGSEKLFQRIFKEKAPKGMGAMIYAHIRAPR